MGKPELTAEQKAAKEALKAEVAVQEGKAKEINDARTGRGTRLVVGMTRGRNPQVITYEEFDESKPDTLPSDLAEFMALSGINDIAKSDEQEKVLISYAIDGFNSTAYTTASDPVAEFVEASWPEEIQKNFRMAVKNYAAGCNVSIEDAVAIIKPGIVKALSK